MGAFDKVFSDIDNTRADEIYVVDDNGWGWFFLAIIASLPFFLFCFFLKQTSSFICQHPVISIVAYGILALIISYVLHHRKTIRYPLFSFIGSFIFLIPMAFLQAVYCIPYVSASDGVFLLTLEWLLSTGIMLGITIFLIAITNLSKNGLLRFIVALIFLIISLHVIHPPNGLSWEYVYKLYS